MSTQTLPQTSLTRGQTSLRFGQTSVSTLWKGVRYEPEALALFARFTTPPTSLRKTEINALIKALKTAGVWGKLDALYILAAADGQAARRNWIADQYNMSVVSSPTFTVDRGYTGDGTSSYLDTTYTPGSGKYALNSAHTSMWSRTSGQNNGEPFKAGTITTFLCTPRSTSDLTNFRINDLSTDTFGSTDGAGHFIVVRPNATTKQAYRAGVSLGADKTRSSTALPNQSFRALGNGTTFATHQLAALSVGSALSAAEAATFSSALSTYMQSVGAA